MGRIEVRVHAAALRPGRASASVELETNAPGGSDFVLLSGEVLAARQTR